MKKTLIVMDLDMKRYDSWIEFNIEFSKKMINLGNKMTYMLPKIPCDKVLKLLTDNSIEYIVFDKWWLNGNIENKQNLKVGVEVVRLLSKNKYDLIIFHFCYESSAFIVALYNKLFAKKVKIIWHQHSEIRASGTIKLLNKIKGYISKIRVLSWFIDQVCPVSEAIKNQLIKKKVNSNKITILYNGVNLDAFNYTGSISNIIEDIKVSKDTKVIISVANLIKDKGIQYLIRAVDLVKRKGYQLKVIIVGEGPYSNEIKTLISELKIDDIVYLIGKRNDVPFLLCAADFLVHPTLKEALSYVIIEAMAARKAVIASLVGGIPELVKNNLNGILVPPGDFIELSKAIIRLIEDREEANKMGARGREIVEKEFTVGTMVENYLKVYEKYLIREM